MKLKSCNGHPTFCIVDLHSKWSCGEKNLITDVPGVLVGHTTLTDPAKDIHTGVTAVLPHGGNLFRDKVMAACAVINGFGKSIGLLQVQELGTIETPIILTNTMSIGTAYTALCKYMLEQNPDIGVTTGTVNCLVTECNDSSLNDIRGMHVQESDGRGAIEAADTDFAEGCVGSGSGMCCLGLKGGIGSASRVLEIDGAKYTVGALVMSNFGAPGNLVIGGQHYDTSKAHVSDVKDRGSIIMILATDIPLSERQLGRVAKRAMISLGRVGSFCGNGSGEIVIAFTTANRVPHYSDKALLPMTLLHDDAINPLFRAVAECVEESVLSSLLHAETVTGNHGRTVRCLTELLEQ